MKLPLGQLSSHLERGLSRIYLIAADEPLFVGEAAAAIRQQALEQGYTERKIHFVERGFRWDAVSGGGDNLSLFASRRIVEIRMSTPRPGDAGAKALRALAEAEDPDRLVIVSIQARLDAAAQRSVWVKTIEQHGVVVEIRPVMRPELPRFIAGRAKQKGLRIDADAAELLADRVEGNLLAADQELEKLALIAEDGHVDAGAVGQSVATSARFDVFRLSDAVVAGDLARALTVLAGLRTEGAEPALVLWALVREITLLARLRHAEAKGASLAPLMSRLGVWQSRQQAVRRALERYTDAELAGLVGAAARADRTVKGLERGQPWQAITGLVLELLASGRSRRTA